jgi:hypothetical protein
MQLGSDKLGITFSTEMTYNQPGQRQRLELWGSFVLFVYQVMTPSNTSVSSDGQRT